MSRLFLVLSGLLFISILSAQVCGTPQETLLERVDAHKSSPAFYQRSAQKYIPVTFHLVARSNGTGRVTEEEVFKQVASLNAQYEDQDALFYIDRLNYFDNDAVYNTPSSSAARTQMNLRRDNNSVNIYITGLAESNSGSPGVTLAYYDPQDDWIVSRKDQIGGTLSTVAHELGHFFSLPHPFSGWDCHPYTLTEYTNPVSVQFTIPCDGGGGSALIELQNGNNCNVSGDRICDTPPDYNLGLLFQSDCAENTSVKDINSTLITPMVNNVMSYYNGCASYAFTPNQKTLINADFFSAQRQYIRTGNIPKTDSVTGPVVYISPINGQNTPSVTNIVLDWEDTPGANKYMILVAQNASFSINAEKYFTTASTLTLENDLIEGGNYFWKVWPYNESQTGAMYSATQNFRAGGGVGINEIKEVSNYSLVPNPVNNQQQALLTLSSLKAFDAEMKVSDASGQILYSQPISVTSGISQHEINTNHLPGGIYFVMLHAPSGMLVERLLILE